MEYVPVAYTHKVASPTLSAVSIHEYKSPEHIVDPSHVGCLYYHTQTAYDFPSLVCPQLLLYHWNKKDFATVIFQAIDFYIQWKTSQEITIHDWCLK